MVITVERLIKEAMLRLQLRGRAAATRTTRMTGAAVAAYVVAQLLLPGTVPVLAPLTAILVVEVNLKDIVTSGVQRIVSVTAGVMLAVGFSAVVGWSWWSLGILVAVSVALGQLLRLGPHMVEVPISAMLVLAVGGAESTAVDRITETLIGAAVGVAVNLVFPPAVRAISAADAVQRYARDLANLLSGAGDELRNPITEQQAGRWMEDARALGRSLPRIDRTLQEAENSRRLNPRALIAPDNANTLRADLDALERTTLSVRSMFRSILDGVRDHPPQDLTHSEDLRQVFAALLVDLASAIQAFGDLARSEGTDEFASTEHSLSDALTRLREARDRADDLQMIDPGMDNGWELSEPVLQTAERVLRDLNLEEQARRRPTKKALGPKVAPLEIIKTAHHMWQQGHSHQPQPVKRKAPRRANRPAERRELTADQTGPHRIPLGRTPRDQALSAVPTGKRGRASGRSGRSALR